jgi:hypothetical protein
MTLLLEASEVRITANMKDILLDPDTKYSQHRGIKEIYRRTNKQLQFSNSLAHRSQSHLKIQPNTSTTANQ